MFSPKISLSNLSNKNVKCYCTLTIYVNKIFYRAFCIKGKHTKGVFFMSETLQLLFSLTKAKIKYVFIRDLRKNNNNLILEKFPFDISFF